MPSAWDEMEQINNGTAPPIHTACWLGQYAFGLIASIIASFFGQLFIPMATLASPPSSEMGGGGRDFTPDRINAVHIIIAFAATFGVFAGSSGGGNPCDYKSGGGPYAFLVMSICSFLAVYISSFFFAGEALHSFIPACAAAAGMATIVGGFAVSCSLAYSNAVSQLPISLNDSVDAGGDGDNNNAKPRPLSTSHVLKIIGNSIYKDVFDNPENLMRIASVSCASLGLHFCYGSLIWGFILDEGEGGDGVI